MRELSRTDTPKYEQILNPFKMKTPMRKPSSAINTSGRLLVLLLMASGLFAQAPNQWKEKVLFTVADEDTVLAREYVAVYNKNRELGDNTGDKSPRQYLRLYKDFKLKVHEARQLGLDTVEAFQREYQNYRNQLAEPYLSDKGVTEELVREAYKRSQYDVKASHIMISFPKNPTPEDTLKAFRTAKEVQKRLQNGDAFSALAKEYSDDTYSAKREGDLGYFTVFDMVYPFESAAYETPVGQVSSIIRTRYGYHLVKPTDKRPARGTVQVRHIMLVSNDKSSPEEKNNAKARIKEIHEQLKNGASFQKLARQHSDDKRSGYRGGLLDPFGINKMYPAFEQAAYALKDSGSISEPVKTPVGWHIIQMVKPASDPSFSEARSRLRNQVESDSRSQQSRESVLRQIKRDYGFKEYPRRYPQAFEQVGEAFLKGQFEMPDENSARQEVLFEFAQQAYTVADFLGYLERNQDSYSQFQDKKAALYKAIGDYARNRLIAYEKKRLPQKYPEFRLLNREYYEGILLFNVSEQEVWRKAMTDTAGLKAFFAQRRDAYRWDRRYKLYTIDAASEKLLRKARRKLKRGQGPQEVLAKLNKDSKLAVAIDSGAFENEELPIALPEKVEAGELSEVKQENDRYKQAYILDILPAQDKALSEIRGQVASDYQNYLEEKWVEELRKKYPIKTREEVLTRVLKYLNGES